MQTQHVYYISGLGADDKIWKYIQVHGLQLHFIAWLEPKENETLENYAGRMASSIQHPNPVLIGLSFGGIMSIEIAKLIPVQKIILISSVKNRDELPFWMKVCGNLKLNNIVPLKSFKILEPIQNFKLGITNKEELQLARFYRKTISANYLKWAVNQILNWQNRFKPCPVIHIHGTRDNMFPFKKICANYCIQEGGHMMIMNKAIEINSILEKELKGV
ncbi:MAG: hypothetical protein RLY16_2470 [Bacteroidota bacterium]